MPGPTCSAGAAGETVASPPRSTTSHLILAVTPCTLRPTRPPLGPPAALTVKRRGAASRWALGAATAHRCRPTGERTAAKVLRHARGRRQGAPGHSGQLPRLARDQLRCATLKDRRGGGRGGQRARGRHRRMPPAERPAAQPPAPLPAIAQMSLRTYEKVQQTDDGQFEPILKCASRKSGRCFQGSPATAAARPTAAAAACRHLLLAARRVKDLGKVDLGVFPTGKVELGGIAAAAPAAADAAVDRRAPRLLHRCAAARLAAVAHDVARLVLINERRPGTDLTVDQGLHHPAGGCSGHLEPPAGCWVPGGRWVLPCLPASTQHLVLPRRQRPPRPAPTCPPTAPRRLPGGPHLQVAAQRRRVLRRCLRAAQEVRGTSGGTQAVRVEAAI